MVDKPGFGKSFVLVSGAPPVSLGAQVFALGLRLLLAAHLLLFLQRFLARLLLLGLALELLERVRQARRLGASDGGASTATGATSPARAARTSSATLSSDRRSTDRWHSGRKTTSGRRCR